MDNSKFFDLFDENGRMAISDGMRFYKKTDEQNNMVRFVIKLKDTVDEKNLLFAAQKAMERHCTLRLVVENDGVRFYLKDNREKAVIHQNDNSRYTVGNEENNGHLTRIGFKDNEITVDFFHGTADGMAILAFSKTLLYYYMESKGIAVVDCKGILTENDETDVREYADSMLFVPEEDVAPPEDGYVYEKAFQLPDKIIESPVECKFYEFKISSKEFESFMRENSSSRSAVFAFFMNSAIYETNSTGGEPIVAALAVNSRPAFDAQVTNRCCVATVPVWYDDEVNSLSRGEQLKKTREMIVQGTEKDRIVYSAQRTRKFNQGLEERFATLEEKKAFARQINKQGGVKYTYGLSYLGEISYGSTIDQYVDESYVMLCANTIPVIMEVAKFKDMYHITYCTQFENDPYVTKLRDKFTEAGIPCTCTQKENFKETLAIF